MVSTTTRHDASPNENTAITKQVPFDDVGGVISGSPLSPDAYASEITIQIKSALIRKEYSTLLIICPIVVFPAPQKILL